LQNRSGRACRDSKGICDDPYGHSGGAGTISTPERGEVVVYAHAGVSDALWPVGVYEADCQSALPREAYRVFGADAAVVGGGGRADASHQLAEKRPE